MLEKLNDNSIIHKIYNEITLLALEKNGIIFGGYVRDSLINDYFKQLYNMDDSKIDSYYIDYSNDIDISFTNTIEAHQFINSLKNIKKLDHILYKDTTNCTLYTTKSLEIYIELYSCSVHYSDTYFVICIDIYISNYLPPFGKLDMLCNGFIWTKNSGKIFSKNTGTVIDTYNDYKRTVKIADILKDMSQFKTDICLNDTMVNGYYINIEIFKRIQIMEEKRPKWSFKNMPFDTDICNKEIDDCECCICYNNFVKKDNISYTHIIKDGIVINSSIKMHRECLMNYLNIQCIEAEKKYMNDIKPFVFKCPIRNDIDFSRAYEYIS